MADKHGVCASSSSFSSSSSSSSSAVSVAVSDDSLWNPVSEFALLLCEFIEVAIHQILFVREVYPPTIFERRRKYGIPVLMARHPQLFHYIAEVASSLHEHLCRGTVQKLVVAILNPADNPLAPSVVERFVFEMVVLASLQQQQQQQQSQQRASQQGSAGMFVEESLRACLLKLSTVDALLAPNPKGCIFRVYLSSSEPDNSNSNSMDNEQQQQQQQQQQWVDVDGTYSDIVNPWLHPVRSVDTSSLQMQIFIEESKKQATLSHSHSHSHSHTKEKSMHK